MKKILVIGMVLCVFILPMSSSQVSAAAQVKTIPWEDTGPFKHVDDTGPHRTSTQLLVHEQNLARMASIPGGVSNAVSQDVGDVAVIVDNGSIFLPPGPANLLDLATPSALRFVPDTDAFDVSFSGTDLDLSFGTDLGLGDDDTTEVTFPAGFPFLGTTYTSIWVNSDGNITLGEGDDASSARNASRHIGGPPRLSPLLTDLNPECTGAVYADVRTDRVVVTWNQIVHFERGFVDGCDPGVSANTVQATLYADGRAEFVYVELDSEMIAHEGFNREAVTGVAEGNSEGPLNEIDLTEDLPGTFGAGAIYEEFHPPLPERFDDVQVAQEFYKTHDDLYDFLVVFIDEPVDTGFAFAYALNIKNETVGLGLQDTFDVSARFGSDGELETQLFMNNINLYWQDANKMVNPPIQKFSPFSRGASVLGPPGSDQISRRARVMGTLEGNIGYNGFYTLGLNSAMSVMAQEVGHRWLAFPAFVHPITGFGPDSLDLLGRQEVHWSFFFNVTVPQSQFGGDPRASSLEGNAILDLGPEASAGHPVPCDASAGESTFLTQRDELIDGYTELDQYFMGLRTASEVGSFWYVDEPRSAFSGNSLEALLREASAIDDAIFCGKRVDLTLSDITDVGAFIPPNGARHPAIGDEIDQDADGNPVTDVKTMAFILVVRQGPPNSPAHASAIQQVDTFRQTWETYANGPATGGRGRFDTSLDPEIH